MKHAWRRELALRGMGAALLAISYAAAALLGPHLAASYQPGAFVLATVLFCTSSLGATLLILGGHLFDPIEVSERWRRLPTSRPATASSEAPPLSPLLAALAEYEATERRAA